MQLRSEFFGTYAVPAGSCAREIPIQEMNFEAPRGSLLLMTRAAQRIFCEHVVIKIFSKFSDKNNKAVSITNQPTLDLLSFLYFYRTVFVPRSSPKQQLRKWASLCGQTIVTLLLRTDSMTRSDSSSSHWPVAIKRTNALHTELQFRRTSSLTFLQHATKQPQRTLRAT